MNQHRLFTIIIIIGLFFGILGCYVESGSLPLAKPVPATSIVPPESTPIQFLNDYRQGIEIAKRESKLVLVFFSLSNSASSQRIMETTFQDDEIKRLSNRFVCISVDGLKESEFCKSVDIKGFPTILFMNSHGEEVQRLAGKLTADQLAIQMHIIIQSIATKSGGIVRK
jgi:thioredoxin-related protein